MYTRRVWLYGAIAATGGALLAGCGANNPLNAAINSSLPEVSNLMQLDGQSVSGTVDGSRATISGHGTKMTTFADRTIPEQNRLRRIRHRQKIDRSLVVNFPDGVTPPDSFQLFNIAFKIEVSDQDTGAAPRVFSRTLTIPGPITYTRDGSTNQYNSPSKVALPEMELTGDSMGRFRDIVTTPPAPNTLEARVSFDTDDTQLPQGTALRFTFVDGTAQVGI